MKRRLQSPIVLLAALVVPLALLVTAVYAVPNIDPLNYSAWSENVGWLNSNPSGGGGVEVTSSTLKGFIWSENKGWISLNCSNTGTCGTVNYHVDNDGAGNLKGMAWGENLGWINFSCQTNNACTGTAGRWGVTINPVTGDFTGQAWAENAGWINFNCANDASCGTTTYKTRTTWTAGTGTTLVVNSNNDANDGLCSFSHCSLREAINEANALAGTQTIAFNIGGGGVQTITPSGSDLPTITDTVTIDGTTQPGYAGSPLVEIKGSAGRSNGLDVVSPPGTVIKALSVIGPYANWGINIHSATGHSVLACYVGLDASGNPVAGSRGIYSGSSGDIIGDGTAAGANTIAGNTGDGILIPSNSNSVRGNFIHDNSGNGITISSGGSSNTIGGTTAADRNVIVANTGNGIAVTAAASSGNVIKGNRIGTDGVIAVPNGDAGILLDGNSTIVGDTGFGGNVISGNAHHGIGILGPGNTIAGNYIGTNAAGNAALGNGYNGIMFSGLLGPTNGNTIESNFIAASGQLGIQLDAAASNGNTVTDNFIGVLPNSAPAGNTLGGVRISGGAHDNTVGIGGANTIANNGGPGIAVTGGGAGNHLSFNNIHDNTGLGIDLEGDGVTGNDGGDGDTGSNNRQNFPVVTSAVTGGGTTTISGTINSTASTDLFLEFFDSAACDASGNGEGAVVAVTIPSVVTNGSGNASFTTPPFVPAIPLGHVITATASRNTAPQDTSEFSACVTVTSGASCPGDSDCDTVLDASDNCPTVSNTGQANTDSGPPPPAGNTGEIDNGSGVATPDKTVPNGDGLGDACDPDLDNDGLPNSEDTEPLGASGVCAAFAGSTDGHPNPASGDITDTDGDGPSWDTDKDGVLDGVECVLGKNPRSGASKPTAAACGGGSDSDLDGLVASAEICKWGTLDVNTDTDGDGKKDCVEANDTSGDGFQNFPGDTVPSARAANGIIQKTLDFDLNGDGVVNFPGDTVLSAKMVNHVGGICM